MATNLDESKDPRASGSISAKLCLSIFSVLVFLFLINIAWFSFGFSFTDKHLNSARTCIGYLIPIGFYLTLKGIAPLKFRSLVLKLSLCLAILNVLLLMIDFWGGELNFLSRAPTRAQTGQHYYSDINTSVSVIQVEELRPKNLQIILETMVGKCLPEPDVTIILRYVRSFGNVVQQSKPVCKIKSGNDARFVIDGSQDHLTLYCHLTKGDQKDFEREFSTNFDDVKPFILRH